MLILVVITKECVATCSKCLRHLLNELNNLNVFKITHIHTQLHYYNILPY